MKKQFTDINNDIVEIGYKQTEGYNRLFIKTTVPQTNGFGSYRICGFPKAVCRYDVLIDEKYHQQISLEGSEIGSIDLGTYIEKGTQDNAVSPTSSYAEDVLKALDECLFHNFQDGQLDICDIKFL